MNMEQRRSVMPARCFAAAFLTDAGCGSGGETTRVDVGVAEQRDGSGSEGCTAVGTVANG